MSVQKKPSIDQLAHFFRGVESGLYTMANFQAYLERPDSGAMVCMDGLTVTYDQSSGLRALIKRAVGEGNHENIEQDITEERFPLKGRGVRSVTCRVEAYLEGETREQAAKRLTGAGHVLGNTGDLAGFLHDHPDEVEKWGWVDAISEDSRWADPDGRVCVPCVYVDGADHYFNLDDFRRQFGSRNGVLVVLSE